MSLPIDDTLETLEPVSISCANRPIKKLSDAEISAAEALVSKIRADLANLSGCDQTLLVAMRRRVMTSLRQCEGHATLTRRKLHTAKYAEQGGCCSLCGQSMQREAAHLHCFDTFLGFTIENTQLVHVACEPGRL